MRCRSEQLRFASSLLSNQFMTAPEPDEFQEPARSAQLVSNIVTTIAARVGYMVSRVLIPPFVLAHVGLEAYGLWTSAFILVSYLGLANLGISAVYVKYAAQYSAQKQHERINELLSTGLAFTIPLSAALMGALVLFWPAVGALLKLSPARTGESAEVVFTVAGVFLLGLSLSAFGDMLNGLQKIAVNQRIWIFCYVLETLLIFVLVLVGRGLRGLAEAFLVRSLLGVILATIYAFRALPWLSISFSKVTREMAKRLFRFGGMVQLQSLLGITLNSSERIAAMMFINVEAAGLLDLAKKWPNSVSSIPMAFFMALMPAASQMSEHQSPEEGTRRVRELYLRGSRYVHLVSAYFCGFMAIMATAILNTWLKHPLPNSVLLLVLFSVTMQVHLLTGPGTSILRGIGRVMDEFYYTIPNLVSLVAGLGIARLAAGEWNVVVVTMAVCASTWVSAVVLLVRAGIVLKVQMKDYVLQVFLPGLCPYAVAALIGIPFSGLLVGIDRVTAAVALCAIAAVYTLALAIVIYRFVLNVQERQYVTSMLARYGDRLPLPFKLRPRLQN